MTEVLPDYLTAWDFLPEVDEQNVHDVDYLRHRLEEVLRRAQKGAEETTVAGGGDHVALALLRHGIDSLMKELAAYGSDGAEMLALLRRSHPQMDWIQHRDTFTGYPRPYAIVDDPASRCARRLRLREVIATRVGRRSWEGRIEGWRVSVVDDGQWEKDRERVRGEVGDELFALLTRVGAELPPLYWLRWAGDIAALATTDDDAELAARWATALGLDETSDVPYDEGVRQHAGMTAAGRVVVRWVHDQARHEIAAAERRARSEKRA